jgi:hypothetical protein
MQLPVGKNKTVELSCDIDATSYWKYGPGGDQRRPDIDSVCPGAPLAEFHTTGIDDLGGCALAVAYESDANKIQPEDFAVFSINQTCPWSLNTTFAVPAAMPPCPNGKCICAWFWIHRPDSGSEQSEFICFVISERI